MRELVVIAIFALTGCEKSSPKAVEPGSAAPISKVATSDGGAGSANEDTRRRLVDEILMYTYEMIPLLASWDGNCAAQIERMKRLEPLVQRIRDDMLAVGSDVASHIKDAMQERKAEVMAKVDQQLAELHLTRDQLESKDQAIEATCGNNPEFKAAMDRIGVFKKKTP